MQDKNLLAIINNIFVVIRSVRISEVALNIIFLVEPLCGHINLSSAIDEEQTSKVFGVVEIVKL